MAYSQQGGQPGARPEGLPGGLEEQQLRTLPAVSSTHSLNFQSFTGAHGRLGLCWGRNTGKRPVFMGLVVQQGTQVSHHGVTIQNAKWCGQLSLGSRGEPRGRGHLGPPTILQLCLWPSGRGAEPSEEAGPGRGSPPHTLALWPLNPDPHPSQVLGSTLLDADH